MDAESKTYTGDTGLQDLEMCCPGVYLISPRKYMLSQNVFIQEVGVRDRFVCVCVTGVLGGGGVG